MTEAERSILIGIIIGDGCITTREKALRVYHSTKQRDYVEYKRDLLAKILNKSINICECTHKHYSGKTYYTCGFTVKHPFYGSEFEKIYPLGKKVISREILDQLSEQAIALWFMDDGSTGCRIHKERGKTTPSSVWLDLATYCSKEEAEIVQKYFIEKWDIKPKLRNTGKQKEDSVKWNINFNTTESKKLYNLIKDYIIPSMQYKLRYVKQQRPD